MQSYLDVSTKVRRRLPASPAAVADLTESINRLTSAQVGALIAFAERRPDLVPGGASLVASLLLTESGKELAQSAGSTVRTSAGGLTLISAISGAKDWITFTQLIAQRNIGDAHLGYWLAAVTLDDLAWQDAASLTDSMTRSGDIFDYRPSFPQDRLLRRYPTGALSEKVALMMPTVISAVKFQLSMRIVSPFVVAKALGHTGGTWDKLSFVSDFKFPEPGETTERALATCGVSYSVTQGRFNPADARLYRLRSETDTIECPSLIVSSIASKMLACPVHKVQLDTRVGTGAFFEFAESAVEISRRIVSACSSNGMNCFYTLTSAEQPTGSSVGGPLELIEAIEALGGAQSGRFDPRGLELQRGIVAEFTARLASEETGTSKDQLFEWILNGFRSGSFRGDFVRVLIAHGVRRGEAEACWQGPWRLVDRLNHEILCAQTPGRLVQVDQRRMGICANHPSSPVYFNLKARKHDLIAVGQPLAEIWSGADSIGPRESLLELFVIEQT